MEQDRAWQHVQSDRVASAFAFDAAGLRHRKLAGLALAGEVILNVGVGLGTLEELLIGRGAGVQGLDAGMKSVDATYPFQAEVRT